MKPEPGFKVRLRRDLSRYGAALAPGAEGECAPPVGRSAVFSDRYVRCRFGETEVDVLFSDLEVTDPRWVSLQEEERRSLEAALKDDVKRAMLRRGPRGGFVDLVVEFSGGRPNEIFKRWSDAEPVVADLRARGLLTETPRRTGL